MSQRPDGSLNQRMYCGCMKSLAKSCSPGNPITLLSMIHGSESTVRLHEQNARHLEACRLRTKEEKMNPEFNPVLYVLGYIVVAYGVAADILAAYPWAVLGGVGVGFVWIMIYVGGENATMAALGAFLAVGIAVWALWNVCVPQLFHVPQINLWQATALGLLCRVLFDTSVFKPEDHKE
jgi:hypothetical protein